LDAIERDLAEVGRAEAVKAEPFTDPAVARRVRALVRKGISLRLGWAWTRPALCLGLDPDVLEELCAEAKSEVWPGYDHDLSERKAPRPGLGPVSADVSDADKEPAALYGDGAAVGADHTSARTEANRVMLRELARAMAGEQARDEYRRWQADEQSRGMLVADPGREFGAPPVPSAYPVVLLLTGHDPQGRNLFDREQRAAVDAYENAGHVIHVSLAARDRIGTAIDRGKYVFVQVSAHADDEGYVHLCGSDMSGLELTRVDLLAETIVAACQGVVSAQQPDYVALNKQPDYVILNWCRSEIIVDTVLPAVRGVVAWDGDVESNVVVDTMRVFHRTVARCSVDRVSAINDDVFEYAAVEAQREATNRGRNLVYRLRSR
jgi:hypothetical protein